MVEDNINGDGESVHEVVGSNSGVEAKRNKIRFKRATVADTTSAFGGSESKPRRSRTIPTEKRSKVTVSDTRPEVAKEVKGKAPSIPIDEPEEPRRRGRPSSRKLTPTIDDSTNTAKFLLTAIEVACVTSVGSTGEMTEWERGLMQAPLQRIIARTPVDIINKGGLYVDIAFLVLGGGIYFSRVLKGVKVPSLNKKKAQSQTTEDPQSPVAAPVNTIVDNIKAGDRDGLAVPIPTVIQSYMNGPI